MTPLKPIYWFVLSGAGAGLLCGSFVLLLVCGFFEDRRQGGYCFLWRRFVGSIVIILVLNILFIVPIIYGIKSLIVSAEMTAKTAVLRNRAATDYALKSVSIVFPESFGETAAQCYRTGISSYIEDQWNQSFATAMPKRGAEFCKKNPTACSGPQENHYEVVRRYANPYHILIQDFSVLGYFLGSIWVTAAEDYNRERQIFHKPDDKGKYQSPPDDKMLAEYRHYVADCAMFKPMRWVDTKTDLVATDANLCVGVCP